VISMTNTAQGNDHLNQNIGSMLLQVPFVERLIYYSLLPDLCARIVFEGWLGYRSSDLIEQKLWIFYLIISADYLFQIRRILYREFYVDKCMYVSCFILILAIHGLLIGVGWKNKPLKIATDTIPMFVVAVNIILSCQLAAYKNFNFARVEGINITFAIVMVTVGIIAAHAGRPTLVSLGGALSTTMSIAIIAVSIWRRYRFGITLVLFYLAVLVIIAQDFNRTTLALLAVLFIILFFSTFVVSAFRLYILFLLIGGVVVSVPLIVPPGSHLARRIEGLNSSAIEQQEQEGTGSIGERQDEWTAIQKKISQRGRFAEIFGLGHGAVYDVVFSNGPAPPNYSNAHFGWALFYLRYGYMGYFYLLIFACLLASNIYRNIRSTDNFNRMALILCIAGIIYIFTYMAFNIILSGLQFMHMRSGPGKLAASGSTSRNSSPPH
jgi:O-antigen ligase